MIEIEQTDDRKEQFDLNHVIMENSGKSWVRDPYDGLHFDKNKYKFND